MREDFSMKKPKADQYPGFAPRPRRVKGFLFTAILLALGLTCFVLFVGPVLVAMALIGALADFSATFAMAWASVLALVVLPWLIEMFLLLQTGQTIRFVMRVLQALSN
jgi:vacuolar-type H+-ATPase subunit I/STV1